MADDIAAEVNAWVAGEIDKQRFGEDYGYAVALGVAMLPTPQGPRQVPMWTLLITARSPLLTEGPMYHGPVPLGVARPAEADVRRQVGDGLKALRDLAASKLASQNGHSKAPATR
jgi:hypothetical protein